MKINVSDLEVVKETYNSGNALPAESGSADAINGKISTFNTESVSRLKGAGYDAIRSDVMTKYTELLNARKSVSEGISDAITTCNSSWESFLEGDTEISDDPTVISQLEGELLSLKDKLDDEDISGTLKSGYEADIARIDAKLKKMYNLAATNTSIESAFNAAVSDEVSKYTSSIGQLMESFIGFGEWTKPTPSGGTPYAGQVPGGGATTAGGSTGGGGDTDGGTGGTGGIGPGTGEEKIPSMSVLTAGALVGYGVDTLLDDENSVFHGTDDDYSKDLDWNTKFVNDMLQRDPDYKAALSDYYSDSEKYPDAVNDSNSLLKYANEKESNMSFNWSDSSIDKMNENPANESRTDLDFGRYDPKVGDVVFFNTSDSESAFDGSLTDGQLPKSGRVGIVEKIETTKDADGNPVTKVYVIEGYSTEPGSLDKVVSRKEYDISDDRILGYGSMSISDESTDGGNQ